MVAGQPAGADVDLDGDGPEAVAGAFDRAIEWSRRWFAVCGAGRIDGGRVGGRWHGGADLAFEELGEAGGEQSGVDGPGDRRVDVDVGDDALGEGAFDVAGSQGAAGLVDEDDGVGPVVGGDGVAQRQVAGAGDEQAAAGVVDLGWWASGSGVDDDGSAGLLTMPRRRATGG